MLLCRYLENHRGAPRSPQRGSVGWRIKHDGAVVGDDGGEATEVALTMQLLPIRGAEDAIKVDEGRGRLLVRPSVVASFERKVVKHAPEVTQS